MAVGKVVVLSPPMDRDLWDIFVSEKPTGWDATLVHPSEGAEAVARHLEDAEYLATSASGPVSVAVLKNAKRLKLVQARGMGTEHLPVRWLLDRGILVANTGGTNTIAVAEHTMMLMLACLKRLLPFNATLREGKYRGSNDRKSSHELYDRVVGIVGLGNIGRKVAKLCHGFGAHIIYHTRGFVPYAVRSDFHAKEASLDELLAGSDVVTLHVPLTESTRGMIGWRELSSMKPSAYLLNTCRGAVVDHNALLKALTENKIAGAGIDVWDPEPPDPMDPILRLPNVVATPHIAMDSYENFRPSCEMIWKNILRVSEGKAPLFRVDET